MSEIDEMLLLLGEKDARIKELEKTEPWLCRECGCVNMYKIAPATAKLKANIERLEGALREIERISKNAIPLYDCPFCKDVLRTATKALAPDEGENISITFKDDSLCLREKCPDFRACMNAPSGTFKCPDEEEKT